MSKILTTSPSVLFQLGSFQQRVQQIMPRPGEKLKLTDIHKMDTYVDATLPSGQEPNASPIDWRQRISPDNSFKEVIAAIEEAGKLRDVSAIRAIAEYENHYDWTGEWTAETNKLTLTAEQATRRMGTSLLPELAKLLLDPEEGLNFRAAMCYGVLFKDLAGKSVNLKSATSPILKYLERIDALDSHEIYLNVWIELVEALSYTKSRQALSRLKELSYLRSYLLIYSEVGAALKRLGLSEEEMRKITQDEVTTESLFDSPMHQSAYRFIARNKDAKRIIFENAGTLNALPDRQAWITINDPKLAGYLVAVVQTTSGKNRGSLDKLLFAAVGARSKDLTDGHYTYYADEIIDAVVQFAKNSPLKDDPEIIALTSQIRCGEDIKLRYIRREESDLKLGDKCGDCTATGSIHFGDSTTWLINPAYQILKMSKGSRFIGKINFTLGTIVGKDGIIIDAIEFNPQAQKGKPYYEDALKCFEEAMAFLKDLARREKRELFGLTTSNSSGAIELLRRWGTRVADGKLLAQLLIPGEDIASILKRAGYEGETSLYYQMLGAVEASKDGARDLTDERLPRLESDVINPAQIADETVAAAMRERDFAKASKLILADPTRVQRIKAIFNFPADIGLSPTFLVKKLEKIYADEAASIEDLKQAFIVNGSNFVRIPT